MEALFDRIRELKTEYAADYTWGVRFDSPGLPVGHVFQRSRVWIDGDPTDELLAGTSVLTEPRPGYESLGQAYIVCGFLVGSGEDRGEALLTECEVMEV